MFARNNYLGSWEMTQILLPFFPLYLSSLVMSTVTEFYINGVTSIIVTKHNLALTITSYCELCCISF